MAMRLPSALLALLAASLFPQAYAQTSNATVINVPVSQYWEGQDGGGTWSTFALQVGTPAYNVRLLPGTSGIGIWIPIPQGCTSDYGSNLTCTSARGGSGYSLWDSSDSSTWDEIGLYNLDLFTEQGIGYSGNGIYGFDTITLGLQGSGLPTLEKQVIAGYATPQFWLGVLPLSPWPLNFTTMNQPQDSLLTSLKKAGDIPSMSWGYTAGGYNQESQPFGSLTIGGYDTSRFVQNNVSFGMYSDINRDLLVPIAQIQTSNGYRYSPTQAEYYFIDSYVPDLWLPPAACQIFEQAFSLTLDNTTGLYLVNSSLHDQLKGQNTSVTFTLGPGNDVTTGQSSDTTFEIEMPYWAFDLEAGYPLLANNTTSAYFPLRQASDNTSQYILGRAFLQSAYVIADHERFNFSVHQALYPSSGTPSEFVSILARDATNGTSGDNSGSNKSSGIGGGAIAGIVIGVIALLAIIGALVWFFLRKKKRNNIKELDAQETEKRPETAGAAYKDGNAVHEADAGPGATGFYKHGELANDSQVHEAPQDGAIPNEMDGHNYDKHPPQQLHHNVYEMDSGAVAAAEVESPYATPRETPAPTPAPGYRGQLGFQPPSASSGGAPSPGIFSPASPHGAPSPLNSSHGEARTPQSRRFSYE